MAEPFGGFPPEGIAFLAGLAADNTRAFFDARRRTYERDVAAPMRLPLPQDHQRGDLLRLDALHASRHLGHPSCVSTTRFADWTAHLQPFSPLHRWLVDNLTP